MYRFKNNSLRLQKVCRAFTIVEVVAALALLSIMLSSVMVLMNRYVDAVIDMQLTEEAFQLARGNMEQLLSETKLSDMAEFGTSNQNPEIEWQTLVEPFYEPVTNQMWIRAVCTAGFMDTKGEHQDVELEHWITNLTAEQIKQILAQQKIESEWMDLLSAGEYSDIQKTTIHCLEQQGLNAALYESFLEQQRRQKLEFIDKNGMEGWEKFIEDLEADENEFLEYEIGMDFDLYNDCAARYVPLIQSQSKDPYSESPETPDYDPETKPADPDIDSPANKDPQPTTPDPDCIDCSKFPPELIPLIESLGLRCC